MSNLPPLPKPQKMEYSVLSGVDVALFTERQLRAFAEEAVRLERERWEKVALRMVNGRLVGPTLCDVPPEVLAATSRKLMEDPEYRAKMLDLSARSQEGQG